MLHDERGFSLGGRGDLWAGMTADSLASDVLATVLPDDAELTGDDHPWDWLAALLRARGVEVATEDLHDLPYAVEFTDRLRDRFPGGT